MVENILFISHSSAINFMNRFGSNLNLRCRIYCLKIIIENVQYGGQDGRQELSLAITEPFWLKTNWL